MSLASLRCIISVPFGFPAGTARWTPATSSRGGKLRPAVSLSFSASRKRGGLPASPQAFGRLRRRFDRPLAPLVLLAVLMLVVDALVDEDRGLGDVGALVADAL